MQPVFQFSTDIQCTFILHLGTELRYELYLIIIILLYIFSEICIYILVGLLICEGLIPLPYNILSVRDFYICSLYFSFKMCRGLLISDGPLPHLKSYAWLGLLISHLTCAQCTFLLKCYVPLRVGLSVRDLYLTFKIYKSVNTFDFLSVSVNI